MTDEEIMIELLSDRTWWEKSIKEYQDKLEEYRRLLSKTNRLIEALKDKIHDSKGTD